MKTWWDHEGPVRSITAAGFEAATGQPPTEDDLERVNCGREGQFGHRVCGWCDEHGLPIFQCPHFFERTKGRPI